MGTGGGPPGPDRAARGAGRDPGPRAGPPPLRTDDGLAVHLLPGCGADHGVRPRGDPTLGPERPDLRRRPPVELRGVRLPRAAADVRHQRLRRDAARARGSGTSSGSRRASRSPAGTAGSPPPTGARSSWQASPSTAPGCSSSPPHATSTSGTPTSRSTRLFEELKATATKKQQAKARANVAKARTRDSMQAFTKLTHEVDGQRRIIVGRPADRADRGAASSRVRVGTTSTVSCAR